MVNNSNKPYQKGRFNNGPQREMKCSCGGTAKMKSRKVFAFGKKSRGNTIKFYKCQSCGKKYN